MNDIILVGDTFKFEGIAEKVSSAGFVYATDKSTEGGIWFSPEEITFVSRPEPTYTLELTASELSALRQAAVDVPVTGYMGPIDSAYEKIKEAKKIKEATR